MINVMLVGAAYLFIAVGLENGVFPLLGETFGVLNWGEARMVAAGVILAGCIRGDVQGLAYAMVCAIIAGSVPGPGHIGPTLLSFSFAAFGASLVSRLFFMDRFGVRLVNFYLLLVLESLIRSGVYAALWGGTGPQVYWITHGMTALVAAGCFGPLKHALGERPLTTRAVGRSTLSRGR
jgi:hypothetical protein